MIARLTGTLLEKAPNAVVVDVAGVGYRVTIPLSTYYRLGEPGSRVELHVHTHVREDTLALFGFGSAEERDIFGRLIGIGGVGPKTAIAVLSGLEIGDLIAAARERDAGRLASIPGIGRKTAERILLDLADRLETFEAASVPAGAPGSDALRRDLVSALVNLGYNPRVASDAAGRALRGSGPGAGFDGLLRESLKMLSR